MIVLVSTGMRRSIVEVFESIAGVMDGSRAPLPVWRSYEVGCFVFEVFESIRGLGCGWNKSWGSSPIGATVRTQPTVSGPGYLLQTVHLEL